LGADVPSTLLTSDWLNQTNLINQAGQRLSDWDQWVQQQRQGAADAAAQAVQQAPARLQEWDDWVSQQRQSAEDAAQQAPLAVQQQVVQPLQQDVVQPVEQAVVPTITSHI
jgi:hypothetical protein